jgi:hypothetical protein
MTLICVLTAILLLISFIAKRPLPKFLLIGFILFESSLTFGQGVTPPFNNKTAIADTSKKLALPDSIISITDLSTQKDSAKINEILAFKVKTAKPMSYFSNLYVDGIKVKGLKPWGINNDDKIVFFKLDHKVQNLVEQFLESKAIDKADIPVYLSVGDSAKSIINGIRSMPLEVKQRINVTWVWVMTIILIIILAVALKNNILKDDNNLYYSLARTQMLYWTILFGIAYLYICKQTGTLPDIPGSILAIMGISAATTAASKVIENKHKDATPIDPTAKSEGFFMDILSDGSSINIQRFQNVAFNFLFGVIFVQKALSTNLMPDFDNNVLLLLGISSGTYATLKITEATKEQNKPAPQVNSDEVPTGQTAAANTADDASTITPPENNAGDAAKT